MNIISFNLSNPEGNTEEDLFPFNKMKSAS